MKEKPMLHASRPPVSLLALVIAGLAFTARASAQEPAEQAAPAEAPPATTVTTAPATAGGGGFGAPGTWVFTYDTADTGSGYAFFHTVSGGQTTIELNPGVDYFLAPNISVGGNLFFSHSSGGGNGAPSSSSVGADVRAGYNLNLTDSIGLWPTARFFVVHHPAPVGTTTAFVVFAPFIWHATTHFFLGGGPSLNVGLSGGDYTQFGLDFILGGWL
jgi:hypothetical protein